MANTTLTLRIDVPGQREALTPPPPHRVRALKRHLIGAFRDLAAARRKDRLIQKRSPEPAGAEAAAVAGACAHCAGSCCMAGGTHAFIDERTLARACAERPGLSARALLGAYVRAVAPMSYVGSCLFHGAAGCTLERALRAELCNSYYCNGLKDILNTTLTPRDRVVVRTHAGELRTVTLGMAIPETEPSGTAILDASTDAA